MMFMKVTTLLAVLALGAVVEARVGAGPSASVDEVNDFFTGDNNNNNDRSLQMMASVSPSGTESPSSGMTGMSSSSSTEAPTMGGDPSDMPLQAVCADAAFRAECVARCAVATCCYPEDSCTAEDDVNCLEYTSCDVLYAL